MTSPGLFPPSRAAAQARLADFAPRAASAYAQGRNHDPGPDQSGAVSRLSPYLRHRLINEHETVEAVLAHHILPAADKFVQEVLWRTYWKGWLEMRPQVWASYRAERDRAHITLADPRALADAEQGRTGIAGFDDWARELVQTGYLHNHARMWFASIWIFTLRLPWTLGADFFLRHLLDGDAASNTLSWRWVAGLQTAGKTYLATAENIARFTSGRFTPAGLATHAEPLIDSPAPALSPQAIPTPLPALPGQPSLLLVTHEDMHPESVVPHRADIHTAMVVADDRLLWGDAARSFVKMAASDTALRIAEHFQCTAQHATSLDISTLVAAAQQAGARQIVTAYTPVGPVADTLAAIRAPLAAEGITLVQVQRAWDTGFWPYATKGFFPFKEKIPRLLTELGLMGR